MAETGAHLSGVWAKATDLQIERGMGIRVIDVNGHEYLDFTGGLGAASTGHAHPKVTQAIAEQAGRMIHAQINVYRHDKLQPLVNKLGEITPDGIDTFYFGSTPDEIVESAVKLAKHATDRRNVITFDGAFHGRTHYTLAMSSSRAIDRAGYGPLPGGVFIAPYPDPHASDQEAEVSRALRGLDRIMSTQVSPEKIAACVIEPVIGERGYIPTPQGFLEGIERRCRDHGILLVTDETQSGFGRTGRMFATEALGVSPDIICMAKGMASGFPFAALGTRRELDEKWVTGSHSGSSNGNPIGCAAALATIEVLQEPGFLDNVKSRGNQLMDALLNLQQLDQALLHVRGRGLMVATEFDTAERAAAVVAHCQKESRLLLMLAGTYKKTIRWSPPLIVNQSEIDEAVSAFASAIRATS
ncbi:aspartate aminotransferase family protein [Ilumatobacter nonamiensis]|uniref:aspartate aminotransferase family protein n=1 Tax=Ilumatobacter nonamiensis TaxID=467093 RepID=UPI00034C8924|nr:aspartate aminotransferase family protein [Ilumatobacter nonamiensis]